MDGDSNAPPVPTFGPDEAVCGNCKLWRPHSVDARGWVGPCRVQPGRGLFPPSAPICDAFAPKGASTVVPPKPAAASKARAVRDVGPKIIRQRPDGNQVVDFGGELNVTRDELMAIFREASGEVDVPLAAKWEGGTLRLMPAASEMQPKDIPIETFFHKIVMVRDRLRTLEQRVNAHAKLSDTEKVEMQQYITRIYGSLTSFNVLFKDKGDQFVGSKGED